MSPARVRQSIYTVVATLVILGPYPRAAAQGAAPSSPQSQAQKPASPDPAAPAKPSEEQRVKEVGGRLVISGETVLVTADPDRPPADASIATKTDTPLRETPRSIAVIHDVAGGKRTS